MALEGGVNLGAFIVGINLHSDKLARGLISDDFVSILILISMLYLIN